MNNYEDLDMHKSACALAKNVYVLSPVLPNHGLYEQGGRLGRSSRRMKDTVVEEYGRRRHKDAFMRFLVSAHSSIEET
jgi:hypothetical protein